MKLNASVPILAIAIVACGGPDAEQNQETVLLSQADQVQLARNVIDDAAATIRQAAEAGAYDVEAIRAQFEAQVSILTPNHWTPQQRNQITAYAQMVGQTIQPQLAMISTYNDVSTTDDDSPPDDTCYSQCLLFLEFACENGELFRMCFGFWSCDAQKGEHECREALPDNNEDESRFGEPCGDTFCTDEFRCAKWLFKKHECVQECGDGFPACPSPQRCRQPLGTSFRRCVD